VFIPRDAWRRDSDRDEAFDSLTTMYDVQAAFPTSRFAEGDFRVTGTELGPGGLLVVEAVNGSDLIRLEVIPETSSPKVESWRLFAATRVLSTSCTRKPPVATDSVPAGEDSMKPSALMRAGPRRPGSVRHGLGQHLELGAHGGRPR
jgi:hypothetical protein